MVWTAGSDAWRAKPCVATVSPAVPSRRNESSPIVATIGRTQIHLVSGTKGSLESGDTRHLHGRRSRGPGAGVHRSQQSILDRASSLDIGKVGIANRWAILPRGRLGEYLWRELNGFQRPTNVPQTFADCYVVAWLAQIVKICSPGMSLGPHGLQSVEQFIGGYRIGPKLHIYWGHWAQRTSFRKALQGL